jgi:hypothetical protein
MFMPSTIMAARLSTGPLARIDAHSIAGMASPRDWRTLTLLPDSRPARDNAELVEAPHL